MEFTEWEDIFAKTVTQTKGLVTYTDPTHILLQINRKNIANPVDKGARKLNKNFTKYIVK